jgi:hypothetical protein
LCCRRLLKYLFRSQLRLYKCVGKKAIVGVAGKGEPTVSSIVGHQDGKVYSIDKADVDKVLGKHYFSPEASRRQDSKKLVRRFLLCGRNSLNAFLHSRIWVAIIFTLALFPQNRVVLSASRNLI